MRLVHLALVLVGKPTPKSTGRAVHSRVGFGRNGALSYRRQASALTANED